MAISKPAFRQPVRMGGPDTGFGVSSVGNAVISQRVEVSSGDTTARQIFTLPSDTEQGTIAVDIVSIDVTLKDVFEASAVSTLHFTYASAGGTELGVVNVSAVGLYRVLPGQAENVDGVRTAFAAASADSWLGLGGTSRGIFAEVSGTTVAATGSLANVVINYTPR